MTLKNYAQNARKSTEDDDHQVMSIEAQLHELREFGRRENLEILLEFTEAKSAKRPGREKFNEMIALIEKSEGVGILAWHPDRLARNSVDGGKIIYLVDQEKIVSLRFPTFWFEPTPQGFNPILSRATFEAVQEVLKRRARPRKSKQRHNFPFTGLLTCGECGSAITAQYAYGNGGTYRYYRCTKKKGNCFQRYVREDLLAEQLKERLQSVALRDEWKKKFLAKVDEWEKEKVHSSRSFVQNLNEEIAETQKKLDTLVSAYIDGDIPRASYLKKKEELLSRKLALVSKKDDFGRKGKDCRILAGVDFRRE